MSKRLWCLRFSRNNPPSNGSRKWFSLQISVAHTTMTIVRLCTRRSEEDYSDWWLMFSLTSMASMLTFTNLRASWHFCMLLQNTTATAFGVTIKRKVYKGSSSAAIIWVLKIIRVLRYSELWTISFIDIMKEILSNKTLIRWRNGCYSTQQVKLRGLSFY